ncbi:MAG: hypothetical protein KA319_10840 [Ferruginibacter sp.]|nr:hypothetical protein [Ferruginibacter sp.]
MNILSEQDQLTNLELEINDEAKQSLSSAAYWAKFISIFIFSAAGLIILLLVLVSGAFLQGFKSVLGNRGGVFDIFSGGAFIGAMLFLVLILGVVYYFLYNFGVKTKNALLSENTEELNKGLNSLKVYFVIMGIFGILGIVVSLFTLTNLF